VRRVADIMAEISAASAEQLAGIEQVNTAIAQMDRSTQQNAALVEQAAAAAAAMREQTRQLSAAVGVFRLAGADGLPPPQRGSVHNQLVARQRPPRTIQKAMQ
jgi:uncharacterized phage infection (PIP) family protein YhgE